MSGQLFSSLTQLFYRRQRLGERTPALLTSPWEIDWRSPCEVGEPRDGYISWQPYPRSEPADFTAMEKALDLMIHPSALMLFGCWFSRNITCLYKGLWIELIFPWNASDLDLLKANQIYHLLMLRKLKRTPSIFIATTRNEITLISLDNDSGQVWLEWLDSGRRIVLAPSLCVFVDRLEVVK